MAGKKFDIRDTVKINFLFVIANGDLDKYHKYLLILFSGSGIFGYIPALPIAAMLGITGALSIAGGVIFGILIGVQVAIILTLLLTHQRKGEESMRKFLMWLAISLSLATGPILAVLLSATVLTGSAVAGSHVLVTVLLAAGLAVGIGLATTAVFAIAGQTERGQEFNKNFNDFSEYVSNLFSSHPKLESEIELTEAIQSLLAEGESLFSEQRYEEAYEKFAQAEGNLKATTYSGEREEPKENTRKLLLTKVAGWKTVLEIIKPDEAFAFLPIDKKEQINLLLDQATEFVKRKDGIADTIRKQLYTNLAKACLSAVQVIEKEQGWDNSKYEGLQRVLEASSEPLTIQPVSDPVLTDILVVESSSSHGSKEGLEKTIEEIQMQSTANVTPLESARGSDTPSNTVS